MKPLHDGERRAIEAESVPPGPQGLGCVLNCHFPGFLPVYPRLNLFW